MVDLRRRSLLKGSLAVSATAALGTGCLSSDPRSNGSQKAVQQSQEEHRAVIIGSGFGGGVAALRLAEAGVPSVVLERGLRWPTGPNATTFPTIQTADERVLWYGATNPLGIYQNLAATPGLGPLIDLLPGYAGVLEPVVSPNLLVVVAAGVGGGSLLYQGMSLQPSEDVFNRVLPKELDYGMMDELYYPRVAEMLKLAVAPDELIASPSYAAARIFAQHTERAGYNVEKVPMPIDWSFALRELEGEMNPTYTNGDVALGVNNGGKHSVDVTYIKQAEATGLARIEPLHNVTDIARTTDGKWQVFVDRTDEKGVVQEQKVLTTNALIMAAGSVNTTKLLLRASELNLIPGMPNGLGKGWGTNGDRIFTWTNPNLLESFGSEQGGPVIYCSKEWDNPDLANTVIQASVPPPLGFNTQTTMLVGYGVSDQRGNWQYDPLTNDAHLNWQREGDIKLHQRIIQRVHEIAGPVPIVGDTHIAAPMTWHPLGGANMESVCDLDGRVHDQPGLYVLDGALIPGSTAACNPSMTIAAVAERAMDNIVQNDIGLYI